MEPTPGRDVSRDDYIIAAQTEIYSAFLRSETQNEAYSMIESELLQGELRWTIYGPDKRSYQHVLDATTKEHRIWTTFIRRLLLQMVVFGFAAYRLVRTGRKTDLEHRTETTSEYTQESVRIEVANSQNLVMMWNPKNVRWDVYESGSSQSVMSKGGWHLLVFSEPRRVGPDNVPIPASAAALAYRNSVYLENLHRNVQRRDAFNTDPVVYTTTSKQIMGASGRPLYDGPRDIQANIIGESRHDHTTWLAERLDSFRKFDEMSKKARASTRSAMMSVSKTGGMWGKVGGTDAGDQLIGAIPEQPRELFVTDGRDAHEMSERRGPQSFETIEKWLRQGIMKAHKIPLQATGETVNSERLASSDRLSQMAISQYDSYTKLVRDSIQTALDKLSSIVVKKDNVFLKLVPCVSAYNLSQMEPILTTDAAVELNMCVYNQPRHYFDRAKIAYRQKIMLEGTQPDGSTGPPAGGAKGHAANKRDAGGSGKAVRNKPKMSAKAKSTRKNKKAAP
jgi:hypothetical protein